MREVVRAIGSRRSRLGRRRFVRALGALLLVTIVSVAMPQSAMLQSPTPPRDLSGEVPTEAPTEAPIVLSTTVVPLGIQSVIQLPAAADAYIASGRPTQNFGTGALFLGYDLADFTAQRILISFDVLSAIPPHAVINSAILQLTLNYSDPANDTPMGTILRRTAAPWGEYTVTWDTEPAWGEIRSTANVGTMMSTPQQWDVTSLVADWVDGTQADYGMEIIGDERVQQRQRAFFSRESSIGPTPHLIVDYTVSNDTLPPVVTVNPLPTWSGRSFEVTWSGSDQGSAGIAYYDVQYQVNGGSWIDWVTGVTFTSAAFTGQDGNLYGFRARGVDNVGNVQAYGGVQASTTVDTNPPVSHVNPLPPIEHTQTFVVSWSGTDDVSGVAFYNVYTSYNGGAWTVWQFETVATSDTYVAGPDGVYSFRVSATDRRGLVESLSGKTGVATAVDVVPPFIMPAIWFPIIFHQ